MDGVDPEVLATSEKAAVSVPGLEHIHVRGRWMGRSLLIVGEGFVSGAMSVASADETGRRVEAAVMTAFPESRAVLWSGRAADLIFGPET
jgi:divalent metal cation (Fe/Co/Zn/Cd) transporter